ncbi:MAG TPA: hypothetical protein VFB52_11900, partial [Solirubrobacterales bacterium]|nr:hypothetical protein [Solirubrobacterales bacterium]
MAPSQRIRRHLQSNAIAYVALFVALSGTAIALPGKNKVKKNDIARGAVVGKAIAADAVKIAKIRDGAVIASKLGPGAVTTPALLDNAVTAPKLAPDSVTRNAIVQGSINGGKIANGAIDSTKVAQGSLLAADFAPGQLSDAFLFADVTGPQNFTIQRPGRVFVTATVSVLCTNLPCNDGYEVVIDGTPVPGAQLVLPAEMTVEQLTLVGLTGPLAAGPHQIELLSTTPSAD